MRRATMILPVVAHGTQMANDEQRARQAPPQEPLPLVDYLFQHLAGVYGTRDLVNQYAAQVREPRHCMFRFWCPLLVCERMWHVLTSTWHRFVSRRTRD